MKQSNRIGVFRTTFSFPVAICAVAMTAMALAGCSFEPAPFNPNSLQRLARAHANTDENPTPEMRPLPTKLESSWLPPATQPASRPTFSSASQPSPTTQPVRRMTLRDIVRVAVAHNADVRVNSYQPAIDSEKIIEAEAAYDLKFFTQFQYSNQNNVFPSQTNPTVTPFGTNTIALKDLQVQGGLRQDTPTGGKIELKYQADQFKRTGPGAVLINKKDPFWVNELTMQVTQPLLQNFGSAANFARIAIARNTAKVSMLDFRLNLEKNLAELEQAYWQLVQAEQDVKIRETLLQQSNSTAQLLANRRGTENTTNTEVAQANAAVEQRRADLVRARAVVEDLSDVLKNKMNDPDFPVSAGHLILAADVPIDTPIVFDPAEQIQTALTYRAELSQQQLKIDSAEVTIGAARNNLLPKLDFVGSVGFDGVGKEFNNALSNQNRFDFIDFSVGVQLEIPLGNREARAILQRTLYQRLQAIEQYRALIDQVTLEVKKADREVQTTWNEMIRTRQSRIAAQEALRRIDLDQENRPNAMSPAFINTKLDLQSRVADTARLEITAIVNYNIAISALERAKGTLLRYDNVVLEEEPKPYSVPRPSNRR